MKNARAEGAKFLFLFTKFMKFYLPSPLSSLKGSFMSRPHVSGDFCIRKCFYADTPSVHTCPPYTLGVSGDFCIRSPEWKFLYTLYPDTCGRSYPYIFVYADVTVSEPVFFRTRFSKMAASRNVVCSMLLGLLSSLIACLELNVAMLNLNFNYFIVRPNK